MRLRHLACVALAALLAAPAATAHVTANPREAPSDSYFKLDFRVPHGCEGSPTTRIAVQIPAGVTSVAPQEVAGWEIEITEGELPEPVEVFGQTVTEGVTAVSWEGGPLPDNHMQEFGLSLRFPDRPGETLWFPVIQECEEGDHRWVTIPVEGEDPPDEPAPGVTLLAANVEEEAADAYANGDGAAETAAEETEEIAAAPVVATTEPSGRSTLALILGAAGLGAGLLALGVALFRRPTQA
jgi:uncharacterized protein YcnI